MRNDIDSCPKESWRRVVYPEQSTAYFKNVVSITVDSDSLIPEEKQNGIEKYF